MDHVKIKVMDSDKLINAINEGSYDVNLSAIMALGAAMVNTKKQEITDGTFYTYQQEKTKAKWIKAGTRNFLGLINDRVYKCSNCGNTLDFEGVNAGRDDANYCPNCGAEMEKDI